MLRDICFCGRGCRRLLWPLMSARRSADVWLGKAALVAWSCRRERCLWRQMAQVSLTRRRPLGVCLGDVVPAAGAAAYLRWMHVSPCLLCDACLSLRGSSPRCGLSPCAPHSLSPSLLSLVCSVSFSLCLWHDEGVSGRRRQHSRWARDDAVGRMRMWREAAPIPRQVAYCISVAKGLHISSVRVTAAVRERVSAAAPK